MRLLLIFLMIFGTTISYADSRKDKLFKKVYELDKALLDKDSIALKNILHKDVTYGHSNGWIERKQEVINDLFNGKLTYTAIENGSKLQIETTKKTGKVLLNMKVSVVVEGKEMDLKLQVMQVWVWEKGSWKLLGRQSVKLD